MCGDNKQFYSPCWAGCTNTSAGEAALTCGCDNTSDPVRVVRGPCDSDCSFLVPFLLFFFLCMTVTFLANMPSLNATLRCVDSSQRSSALGGQWLIVRLLGTIPGPVAMGNVFDSACHHWPDQGHCGGGTSTCQIYENNTLSVSVPVSYTHLTLPTKA